MPIITISRGTFSGGKDLGECLADKLGYPCVSREVIVEAAETYGVSESVLFAALSRAPSLLDRVKRDREHYLAFIKAALCQRAKAGNLVYHGLGGHHLLAGIRHVIRVRVVADISYRIQAAMKRLSMTSHQAEAYIRRVDGERVKWTQFLYGVGWEDPRNYDVVLNLERLGIQGACATVVRMAELEMFQPTPESLAAMENLALSSQALAALARDKRTRDGSFRVQATAGVVTVEGVVRVPGIAESVAEVVGEVEGVKQVVNNVVHGGYPV
ncbi:MAG TPA: cytidylate kinase-like family protein [Candidatus Methylomirabilis sp.]|nr:cytidylate kinase-like family protein [Candidatus Methylomirabilis sp.]